MTEMPELTEAILNHVHDGAYCVDRDRRIERWNHAAEVITGFSAEEVIGSRCADNILNHIDCDGQQLCKGACPLAATMEDERFREADVFLHHKDGHRVSVRVRTLPIRDEAGNVTGGLEIFTDLTDRYALEEQLHELQSLALADELTELPNRRYMQTELGRRFDEFVNEGWPFGVIIGDIDKFKAVNDTYGHQAGDLALKMIAKSLRDGCRPFDSVGRWGGEEFLAVVRNVDGEALRQIAERFRILVEQSFYSYEGTALSSTMSFGGAVARKGDTLETLIERADRKLYMCKENGRNRVSIAGLQDTGSNQ